MAKLRLIWSARKDLSRQVSEDELIAELEHLAEHGFAGLPEGPVVVEGLDARHCVAWRAHYKNAQGLAQLLHQLSVERSVRQRERATHSDGGR